MPDFVLKLATAHLHRLRRVALADLACVEAVAANRRLGMHLDEIGRDLRNGIAALQEAPQLWVVAVTTRQVGQHGLGQQGLTPKRYQPVAVDRKRTRLNSSHVK